jgi:acetyl-CoA carboxylase biotin carboxyl carrier protein
MKIYNDIKSPVTGTIIQILADECSLVEFEQPLVKVRVDK